MIIDTSAILAILQSEPEAVPFTDAIEHNRPARVSAGTYLEAAIVIDGNRSPALSRRFDEFLREAQIMIEPVTAEQVLIAREAYRTFGRGSGHPAKLNIEDGSTSKPWRERTEASARNQV